MGLIVFEMPVEYPHGDVSAFGNGELSKVQESSERQRDMEVTQEDPHHKAVGVMWLFVCLVVYEKHTERRQLGLGSIRSG